MSSLSPQLTPSKSSHHPHRNIAPEITNQPPSPPNTEDDGESKLSKNVLRIIAVIKARRDGLELVAVPWLVFPLKLDEFHVLRELIQQDQTLSSFVNNKLRYDYFPTAERYILRMPTDLHEHFAQSVTDEIARQLAAIEGPARHFAQSVLKAASSRIKPLDPEAGLHDPDASFKHVDAQYPGVVLEVSFSQKRKDLSRLADDYITGTDGNIRRMIGLDIEYTQKEASLSVWEPRYGTDADGQKYIEAHAAITAQIFRAPSGDAVHGAGLTLRLRDFAPDILLPTNISRGIPSPLDQPIHISAADLCAYLATAEVQSSLIGEKRGALDERPGLVRKRRRLSPEEEIEETRETKYQFDEERIAKRLAMDDSSFDGSLPSEPEMPVPETEQRVLRSNSQIEIAINKSVLS